MTNPDELERLARAATPGPWRLEMPHHQLIDPTRMNIPGVVSSKQMIGYVPQVRVVWTNSKAGPGFYSGIAFVADDNEANAAFIAAANPATILALLSANREMRTALERIADPRNIHFAGDAQVVARSALTTQRGD